MRRAPLLLTTLAIACGGDSPAAPSEPYPAAAGSYAVTATFDDLASAVASGTGTLTFTQTSRQVGTLGGTMSLTTNIGGSVTQISGLNNPSITTAGAVTFSIGQGSSVSWIFNGTLSGTSMTGRHTISDGTTSFSGDWTATRVGANPALGPVSASVGALDETMSRLAASRD